MIPFITEALVHKLFKHRARLARIYHTAGHGCCPAPGGPGGGTDGEPTGDEGYLDKPGLGRPKAMVPFALPVRITDNDMVNTNTLKVEASTQCETPPDGTDPVCFPAVVDGTFVPIDPEEIAGELRG